jgi:hypothetical protein
LRFRRLPQPAGLTGNDSFGHDLYKVGATGGATQD